MKKAKTMFLSEKNISNSLSLSTAKLESGTVSIRLYNSLLGSLTCWLVNDKGQSISTVDAVKSSSLWLFNFPIANLQKGVYWVIIRLKDHQFSRKLLVS